MNKESAKKQSRHSPINGCIRPVLATLFALLSSCSLVPLAGSGTEEGNPAIITGFVYDTLNQPVSGAVIRLLPEQYNPVHDGPLPDSLAAISDRNGRYRFLSHQGTFTIFSVDQRTGTNALCSSISVTAGDSVGVIDTLRKPGFLKVTLPDTIDVQYGYFYIPGTLLFTFVGDNTGFAVMETVPAGIVPSIRYSAANAAVSRVIRYNVPVDPNDTTVVALPAWKYAARLTLNTAATGANIAGDEYGFPVLVRLSSANFDFSLAKSDGTDLRFVKNNGTSLSCEIEQWNAAGQSATIWVKVDTIRGNDSIQSITMLWGNASAGSGPQSNEVFDTAAGFQGVWHLGEPGNSTVFDATENGFTGTAIATSTTPGIIGMAREFDGETSGIVIENSATGNLNFDVSVAYTFSAWVCADSLDSRFHAIVAKGDYQYSLQLRTSGDYEMYTFDNSAYESTQSKATAGAWQYVVGIRSAGKQALYVNGVLVCDTMQINVKDTVSRNTSTNVTIGTFEDITSPRVPVWDGRIDEVRIQSIAPNADWIRLCYMNQRSDDKLVVFSK